MSINRHAWPETFTQDRPLKWSCGECGSILALLANGLRSSETGPSKEAHELLAWEPEWTTGRFVADYACAHCGDLATVIGSYTLVEDPDSFRRQEQTYYEVYRIRAIDPAPLLISIPEEAPDPIREQVHKAFRLFWIDNAACANALRGAVELLLDHHKIRKTSKAKGTQARLTLHARIQEFTKSQTELGAMLMAIKWIGNGGSHSQSLARERLFDGFDLLEHMLRESFAPDRKRLERIAKRVNRSKGRG